MSENIATIKDSLNISEKISQASPIKMQYVDELPEVGEEGTAYVVVEPAKINADGSKKPRRRAIYIYDEGWRETDSVDLDTDDDSDDSEKKETVEHEEALQEVSEDLEENPISEAENDDEEEAPIIKDSDVQEDFDALKQIPYIDLYQEHSKAKAHLQDLNELRGAMDSISGMSQEQYAAILNMMDEADRQKYAGGVDEFNREFPAIYKKAQYLCFMLKAMLDQFSSDDVLSTTFISQSMVESGKARLESLEKSNPVPFNYKILKKRLEHTIQSYENRTFFTTLFNKLRYPTNTLTLYREFKEIGPDAAMSYINRVMKPVFNDQNMTRFRSSMTDRILMPKLEGANRDMVSVLVFFMTYWLAKIHEKELTSGYCADVKTFIMNVYDTDPSSNIYDVVGGKEFFYDTAYWIFMMLSDVARDDITMAQAKKMNSRVDQTLGILAMELVQLQESEPGKVIGHATTLEECCPEVTFEDVLTRVKELMEENDIMNLDNQKVTGTFNDLGTASVDASIMPEATDNRDAEDVAETEAVAEATAEEEEEEEEVCEACRIHLPTEETTPSTPTGVAN